MSRKEGGRFFSEVRPKKFLGQHFLTDESVAKEITGSLSVPDDSLVIEIGPGMGVLTHLLLELPIALKLIEIDHESVEYLHQHYPDLKDKIIEADVLKTDWSFSDKFSVIGNFPYNISSQILFKVLEEKNRVVQVVGMFQKEVAERITSAPGNKNYGILSVLLQAWFDCEYLFTVDKYCFHPPPKVQSGVIRLTRNSRSNLLCSEADFKKVVKQAFNQRRKTLRNSLKSMLQQHDMELPYASLRPEQLTWKQFEEITCFIYKAESESK